MAHYDTDSERQYSEAKCECHDCQRTILFSLLDHCDYVFRMEHGIDEVIGGCYLPDVKYRLHHLPDNNARHQDDDSQNLVD